MVNDIYKRFIKKKADDGHYLLVSRISIVILLLLSAAAAWQMDSIAGAWIYIIEIISGISIILMLRWFWWRINAWSEIASMISALLLANGFLFIKWFYNFGWISESLLNQVNGWYHEDVALIRAAVLLVLCTLISLIVTFMTKPVENDRLLSFYKKVRPKGWWGPIAAQVPEIVDHTSSQNSWLGFVLGVTFLNSILFSVGHAVLGSYTMALILIVVGGITGWLTIKLVVTAKTQETL
jgi:SSS family solute:Na+ symporter